MKQKKKFKLSVWQFLALAYLAGALFGSVLLILPFATKSGEHTTYLNALFTAVSAVCVTGLSPYDIATHWSVFGQIVILILIQASGLGFMTLVSAAFLIFKHNMGIGSRNAFMLDSGGKRNGIGTLLKRIVIGTALCETVGTFLLMIRFIPEYGAIGIYYSIWHSISAFCNAGFDIMGSLDGGKFVSLTAYASDPLVTLTICALIILGGLGFCVWGDVIDCKMNFKKFQLNTKIVLIVNAVLIVLGTALFMLFEWNATQAGMNFGQRLLASFFDAVTPRTAGFAITDYSKISDSGYMLTILFMFVGGGSGSTAGGIKVGTFAVIIMGMLTAFRGRRDINIGKRRIEQSLLSQALAILAACLMILFVSITIMCYVEPTTSITDILFECVSALSNTGLSISVTTNAATSAISKIILILLMYAGRVGILTLALALGENKTAAEIRKPVDTLLIG